MKKVKVEKNLHLLLQLTGVKLLGSVRFFGQIVLYYIDKKGDDIMKTNRNEEFIITDGYLLVMEAIRQREEKAKYIWDVEDDSYYFEERF